MVFEAPAGLQGILLDFWQRPIPGPVIARAAYVWGWPMVNQINRRAAFAQVPEPGRLGGVRPMAPTGYVCMLSDYIQADQHFVTCTNQDTVYGAGFMSAGEPIICRAPPQRSRTCMTTRPRRRVTSTRTSILQVSA